MKIRNIALGAAAALAIGFATAPTAAQAGPSLPTCTPEAVNTLVTPVRCTWTVVYDNNYTTTYVLNTNGQVRIDVKNSGPTNP